MSLEQNQNHQQCLEKLLWATEQLGVEVSPTQLAKIAQLIVQTMTGPRRCFHSTEHMFEVGGSTDAIEILAGLFHDIVYVQVDGSINFNFTYYLAPFFREEGGKLSIRDTAELPNDSTFEMVAAVFGFVPGQVLSPFAGQNEFLSAVVAAKALESFFSPSLIVQLTACIEATIPFRPLSESGLTPSEVLYQHLKSTNEQFNLQLTDEEIRQTLKQSVRVTNRDVGSFAHPSSAVFLANTWNLLPETNHNLQKTGSYTVRDYRIAIQKMTGFMNFLKPKTIFQHFQGEPDDKTYHSLVEQAKKNLEIGRLYLESKLITNTILEALSLRLGQDISLAIMMGELPDSGYSLGRLGDSFPNLIKPYQPTNPIEKEVCSLLNVGRSSGGNYDLKTSPLTAFVVNFIGFDGIRQLREQSNKFFQGTISSEDFLASCNPDLIRIIANEVIELLENRKLALRHPRQQLASDLVRNSNNE
ncbi:MAG: hypothetical protein F6K47_07000 [Symploca sp. SIO2E6]|nr:hypothetical protein [Symploca sp. SIO2E6]